MKKQFFFSFILLISSFFISSILYSQSENVGIGVPIPLSKLHVDGTIRSDSLSGTGVRVAIANPDGEIEYLVPGNNNDIIHQTPQGPAWKSSNSNNSGNDCAPFECPTTFSLTSQNGMYFGTCLRYCGTLEEDGFTDWRVPTIDEALNLAPYIPAEVYGIWTRTRFVYTADPSWPGSERLVTFNLTTGDMTVIIAVNQTLHCKCVR